MLRNRIGLMFLVVLCVVAVAVGSTTYAEKVLRWPIDEDPCSLDPPASYANTAIQICQNLFDGPTALNDDLEVVPSLAKSWEISQDGLLYTFHLREDVKFHDGKPFTASDLKYSWERSLWPETGSYSTFMMGPIEGASAVEKGETRVLESVTVIDDYTIQVKLAFEAGYFLSLTSRWQYWAVDKDTIDKYGDDWTRAGKLNGTGAYELAEWVEGDHVTLTVNPNYWGRKGEVDRVEMPIIPDVATAMLQYEAGEVDAVANLTSADVLRYSLDPILKEQLQITPVLRVTWLGLNMNMPPFGDNKALREALAYGIDRQKLVDVVFQGIFLPAYSFLPPGMPCHNPDLKPYAFNLEKARAKMEEAGYPEGEGLDEYKITLYVSERRERVAIIEFVQAQLLENLGISAALEIIPGMTYNSRLLAHDMQMFRGGMGADYPDAQEFLEYLAMCGYTTNYGEYCNPALDLLVLEGNRETDPVKRCQYYGAAEEIFLRDVAIIPLVYNAQTMVVKPYVEGFSYTPIYVVPFNQVDIVDH